MARIVTCILRIASIAKPTNLNLDIAALVFTNAGVILLYIINLLFAQRLLRAQHPRVGWSRIVSHGFKALYVLIVLTIAMLITVVVQMLFTLNTNTHRIDRDIQLYGITTFSIIAFLPIPIIVIMQLIPRLPKGRRPDKFGRGRWREKIAILLTSSFLICFGACYKCGTLWMKPVPRTEPMPRYFSRAAFYVANFTVEILVVYLYALVRVDLRFWVPNGASKRRHFRIPEEEKKEEGEIGAPATATTTETRVGEEGEKEENEMHGVFSEEETFDTDEKGDFVEGDEAKRLKDLEARAEAGETSADVLAKEAKVEPPPQPTAHPVHR